MTSADARREPGSPPVRMPPASTGEDAARLDRRGCLAASARARHHTGRPVAEG